MSTGLKQVKHNCANAALTLKAECNKVKHVFVNVHLPTAWKTDKELQDAPGHEQGHARRSHHHCRWLKVIMQM